MLDLKHKNIGATVSMLGLLSKITDGSALPKALTELFMAEANSCDYLKKGPFIGRKCGFNPSDAPMHCRIGECPLGPLVDKELDGVGMADIHDKLDNT